VSMKEKIVKKWSQNGYTSIISRNKMYNKKLF